MKTYRKIATVEAKLFEPGDEDGFIEVPGHYFDNKPIPFIVSLENQRFTGEFGKNYICSGIKGERWLVEKDIFESTYEEVV